MQLSRLLLMRPPQHTEENCSIVVSFRDCGEREALAPLLRYRALSWCCTRPSRAYFHRCPILHLKKRAPWSLHTRRGCFFLIFKCACDGMGRFLHAASKRASHVHLPSALSGYATRILIRFLSHTLVFMSVVFLAAGIPSG
jgi:hypothetical protein